MSTAISVDGISKTYRLGAIGSGTLGEDLSRAWARLRGMPDPSLKIEAGPHDRQVGQTFWALEDVSFQVKEGEVLGVVGRNGAGKSTLFKILSQVTAPSSGRIAIRGRVASLLEVGTGFHPDLTGRENVFLNGAILGMTKEETKRNFDEIVAFSECEAFIDTPVKRYSSGMYVRLAFAVAAHLESEILIVDEVLAVGDAQFQEKCLGKMRDVSTDGRTVLFVSHSMAAVMALCDSALLLSGGRVAAWGEVESVANEYNRLRAPVGADIATLPRAGSGKAKFTGLSIGAQVQTNGSVRPVVTGRDVFIEAAISCGAEVAGVNVALEIYDPIGYRVMDINTGIKGEYFTFKAGDGARVRFCLIDCRLRPGQYRVDLLMLRPGDVVDHVQSAGSLVVVEDPNEVQTSEFFPGVYRCRFTHEVLRGGQD